jgi:hypothetical protein
MACGSSRLGRATLVLLPAPVRGGCALTQGVLHYAVPGG